MTAPHPDTETVIKTGNVRSDLKQKISHQGLKTCESRPKTDACCIQL